MSSHLNPLTVSVVIPTRNREASLHRCLVSLAAQTFPLLEVIVVDASDNPTETIGLSGKYPTLELQVLGSKPSVCVQRNSGIRHARGSHILLCDDDIELSPTYVAALASFMTQHTACGAASGLVSEANAGTAGPTTEGSLTGMRYFWKFIFQLTVWSDADSHQVARKRFLHNLLNQFYQRRGNTWTLAGWPLLTQVHGEWFRTSIFSLEASLVRRDWLLASPFDELLDPHGIGDNYGVELGFPSDVPMFVLQAAKAKHYREQRNRLATTTAYYRRILALHYFMTNSRKFTVLNRAALIWSLIGNLLPQLANRDFNRAYATSKAGVLICAGRNPYCLAKRRGLSEPIHPNL